MQYLFLRVVRLLSAFRTFIFWDHCPYFLMYFLMVVFLNCAFSVHTLCLVCLYILRTVSLHSESSVHTLCLVCVHSESSVFIFWEQCLYILRAMSLLSASNVYTFCEQFPYFFVRKVFTLWKQLPLFMETEILFLMTVPLLSVCNVFSCLCSIFISW